MNILRLFKALILTNFLILLTTSVSLADSMTGTITNNSGGSVTITPDHCKRGCYGNLTINGANSTVTLPPYGIPASYQNTTSYGQGFNYLKITWLDTSNKIIRTCTMNISVSSGFSSTYALTSKDCGKYVATSGNDMTINPAIMTQ